MGQSWLGEGGGREGGREGGGRGEGGRGREGGWEEEERKERGGRGREGGRERPDSVAEQLCSKAMDWEVSGLMLVMGILSLTRPSPRVSGRSLMPLCSAPWCL